jgi:hypothetical protein
MEFRLCGHYSTILLRFHFPRADYNRFFADVGQDRYPNMTAKTINFASFSLAALYADRYMPHF